MSKQSHIEIEAKSGMLLARAWADLEFAAKLFKECDENPGCPAPYKIKFGEGDSWAEYFAEDIDMLLGESE